MSTRRLHLLLIVALGLAGGALPAIAGSVETTPVVEAVYPHWLPEQEAVKPTKSIDFVNKNGLPHGIRWTGGPSEPKCTGVPVNSSSSSWSGSCTFEHEGTYTFECTVHPVMKGTIYVNATGTIPPPPPAATTEAASGLSETAATLNGTVNPKGQETSYDFEYGPTTAYGGTAPVPAGKLPAGSANVAVSASVTGLSAGGTYHFRLVATSAFGTTDGADQTFTTLGPPSVTTGSVGAPGETTATLKGTINPHGEVTKYFFSTARPPATAAKRPPRASPPATPRKTCPN